MADTKLSDLPATTVLPRAALLYTSVSGVSKQGTAQQLRAFNYLDIVQDYGADPTYATDSTTAFQSALTALAAAGGGVLFVPTGHYKISGALQNTGTDNAQIVIPTVAENVSQVSIVIIGAQPAPNAFNFNADYPLPTTGYSVMESTLTGQSGTACMIGAADHGSSFQANNLQIRFENMIFVAPSNPTITLIDLRFQYGMPDILKNCLFHANSVVIGDVVEPTHSNSYAFKCPGNNQAASCSIYGTVVFGFYTGMLWGENLHGVYGLDFWACRSGVEFITTSHGSSILKMGIFWCPYGIYCSSTPISVVLMYLDLEHAPSGTGWQEVVADVYDPNSYLYMNINNWLAIQPDLGPPYRDDIVLSSGCAHVVAVEAPGP